MNGNLDNFFYTDPSQQSWLQTHEDVWRWIFFLILVVAAISWLAFKYMMDNWESKGVLFKVVVASAALVSSAALFFVFIAGSTKDPTPAEAVSNHYGVEARKVLCPDKDGECVSYVDKDGTETILRVAVDFRDDANDGWPVTVERLGSTSKESATK